MERNVSVVCVCSAPNILISGKIIKEMPGSVASGTHCIYGFCCADLQKSLQYQRAFRANFIPDFTQIRDEI
jgi:hypothetical protein